MIKTRKDIKNLIVQIEQQFPVNDWKFEHTHVWPIIRLRLFFYLISKLEENEVDYCRGSKEDELSKGFFRNIEYKLFKLKKLVESFIKGVISIYWIKKLPKKRFLYFGHENYRVNYKNVRYNKFFDTINDVNDFNNCSLIFEPGKNSKFLRYNEFNIFNFQATLNDFIKYKNIFSNTISFDYWNEYNNFIQFLKNNRIEESLLKSISFNSLSSWYNLRFRHSQTFFKKCMKSVNPEKTIILCYYFDMPMALTSASNLKGIPTFEMQHGPMSTVHMAYSSWSTIPKEGYHVLPRYFLCWDKESKIAIEDWSNRNDLYTAEIFGNPWVDYWKGKDDVYAYKGYILYSLQPLPLTLSQLFFTTLIKTIKESKKIWFIRLHPRQLEEYKNIENLLRDEGVLEYVNLKNASYDPLPLILANASLHVTHFSGTTLEADSFNLKTILINQNGRDSFINFINDDKAYYIDYKDLDFKHKFLKHIINE